MADIYEILTRINNSLKPTLDECGFIPMIPKGVEKGQLPAVTEGGKITITYKGVDRALKIEQFDGRLSVTGVLKEGEIADGDYAPVSLSILNPEETDDKEIKYLVNEISDSVRERFSKEATKKLKKTRLPSTVSKSKVENGNGSYDEVTLVSRIVGLYPDLRPAYKENYETYGELLADEFFLEHGNQVILDAIRRNDKNEMKKLFTVLNEMYLDGTGNTQSLIVVTILGSIDNNQELLANCTDYMDKELLTPVIQVNKYLATSKSAKLRLENPPAYKPKKVKKPLGSRIGM